MAAVELFFSFSFSLNPALVLTARFVLHSLTSVHFHFVSHVFGLVSSYKHRHVWGNFWCRPRIPHRANCEGMKHEGRQKVNVEVDSSPHTSTALSQRPDDLRYWNTIQFFIFQLFPFGASHPVRCEDAHQPSSFPPAWCIQNHISLSCPRLPLVSLLSCYLLFFQHPEQRLVSDSPQHHNYTGHTFIS